MPASRERLPIQKQLRYPRRGLAIVPSTLHPLLGAYLRHPTLIDGTRSTPVKDLGPSVWHSMSVEDCRRCAQGMVRRLNHIWAEPQRLKQMASIPLPINGTTDLPKMEISSILRDTLEANGLMDVRKLSEMSLLDFWSLKNVGSQRTLELLGLLEAGYESEGGETVTSSPTEATQQLIERISQRLGDADIAVNDIRFGSWISSLHPKHLSLRKALAALRVGARVTARDPWPMLNECLHAIDRKLETLYAGSLEDDLNDILLVICRGRERKAKTVAMRLGWSDGVKRTLQEVGDLVGLTRERVRQMESRAQKLLDERSVYSPKLTQALLIARESMPCRSADYSKKLIERGVMRSAWPASTVVMACVYLGLPHGLTVVNAGAGEILAGEIANTELAERIRTIARKLAQRQGGANLMELAYRASEELERWISRKEAHAVVSSLPDVEWLDEGKGWFWCGEPAKSRVIGAIRKMLSVTPRIPIDELYEGIIRHSRMDEEGIAPKPIVQLMCSKISWLKITQISHVRTRVHLDWRTELVGVEKVLVEELKKAGNALDHYDFKRRCMARGVPEGSFTVYEGNSPVIRRVSRGIWGLRGAVISPRLLVELNDKIQAREQALARKRMANFPPGSLVGDSYFRIYNITASIFRNHCITLTMSAGIEPGTTFTVSLDKKVIGRVVVTEDRRLKGLIPLLKRENVQPGQTFAAKFDLTTNTIELERMPAAVA